MATAEATREFSASAKDLGEKIIKLTLKEAKELSDYLEEVHGIKPAAGGAVMMAGLRVAVAAVHLPVSGSQDRVRRNPGRVRRQEDRRDQGRSCRHGVGPEEEAARTLVEGVPSKVKEGISKRQTRRSSRRSWKKLARRYRSSGMPFAWTGPSIAAQRWFAFVVRVLLGPAAVTARPGSSENLPLHESRLDSTRQATDRFAISQRGHKRAFAARTASSCSRRPDHRHLNLGATKAYGHHRRTTPASRKKSAASAASVSRIRFRI